MKEKNLHSSICQYLKAQYPNVLFNTDLSGLKMTMGQAVQVKKLRSSNSFPDLFIIHPKNGYCGLFIELKIESPYKKNGEIKANDRLKDQEHMLNRLRELGYYAVFGVGFERTKEIIDKYLNN